MFDTIETNAAHPEIVELAKAHDTWIERVKNEVPADKLLIHKSKDGWAPICAHLHLEGTACPSIPYPHINTRQVRNDSHFSLIACAPSFFYDVVGLVIESGRNRICC